MAEFTSNSMYTYIHKFRSKLVDTCFALFSLATSMSYAKPTHLSEAVGWILLQVNEIFHKLERVNRDCIETTRDKTRIIQYTSNS